MNENAKENTDKAVSLPFFGIPKLLPFLHPYRKRIVIMVNTSDRPVSVPSVLEYGPLSLGRYEVKIIQE